MKTKLITGKRKTSIGRGEVAKTIKNISMKNKYKVPLKLWQSFRSDTAQKVFTDVYEQSIKNQAITVHPKAAKIPVEQWKTICWNMACYAAWAVSGDKIEKGATVIDLNSKGEKTKSQKAK